MKNRELLAGLCVASITWGIGYFATVFALQGMEARKAYGVIFGWWLTAYVRSKWNYSAAAALPLAAFYAMVAICTSGFRNGPMTASAFQDEFITTLGGAIFVASPIAFDATIGWVRSKVTQRIVS